MSAQYKLPAFSFGQFTVAVPDLDMVVVRHGATPLDKKDALKVWMGEFVDAFR